VKIKGIIVAFAATIGAGGCSASHLVPGPTITVTKPGPTVTHTKIKIKIRREPVPAATSESPCPPFVNGNVSVCSGNAPANRTSFLAISSMPGGGVWCGMYDHSTFIDQEGAWVEDADDPAQSPCRQLYP
jgi:hypothetical protein